jgi:alpha-galactosidase
LIQKSKFPENDAFTNSLITNDEIIAVNQKGNKPKEVFTKDEKTVWMSKNANNSTNVALFNRGKEKQKVEVNLSDLGLDASKTYKIRDLWNNKGIGQVSGSFYVEINSHGAGMYLISSL